MFWRLRGITSLRSVALPAAAAQVQLFAHCGGSRHDAVQKQKEKKSVEQQYAEAMAWCTENNVKAYAGAYRKGESGERVWPDISQGSLDRRLTGKVDNTDPHASRRALLPTEESQIVEAIKEKNAHGQGIDRKELGHLVMESLALRPVLNRGRNYVPLNQAALKIVEAGEPQQDWFAEFFARNPTITEKHACNEKVLRAKWMTPLVSANHFEKLGAMLLRAGILVDGMVADPRRLLNSDECPNPWQGTGGRSKVLAEVGKPCVKLITAAREHSSLDVCCSLDGHLFGPHVIFAGKVYQRQMIPDKTKVPFSHVSVTEKGYQTGGSLLTTLKFWDADLKRRGVPKPIVWTTDGHASRFNLSVLRWCRENGWLMYVYPPHTTGIHQWLDQIFKTWHTTFNARVKAWCSAHVGDELDKAIFTQIFSEAWQEWQQGGGAPPKNIAGAQHCGVSVSGLNPGAIPKSKFVLSESVTKPPPALTATTPAPALTANPDTTTPALADPSGAGPSTTITPATTGAQDEWSPPEPDEGSYRTQTEYWKRKCELAISAARDFRAQLMAVQNTPLTLKDWHPSFQVKHAAPRDPAEKARGQQRIKGAWGDMGCDGIDGTLMEEMLDEQEANEKKHKEEVAQKKRDAETRRAEREEEAAAKKSEKEAQREAELPVTELLKRLRFTGEQEDTVSAAQLTEFVKHNRLTLRALQVDLTSTARKTLMPILIEKVPMAPVDHLWTAAPPRALTGPTEVAPLPGPALLPAPPDQPDGRPTDTSPPRPERPSTSSPPSPTNSTPEKPPEKRGRPTRVR